jgi:carbamoyltransferase
MPYWGPEFSKKEVEEELKKWEKEIAYLDLGDNWEDIVAELIANGKIVSIFQGRMEFGPRALGNRSVLGDPRTMKTRDRINSTIKRRPWFQPFAPSVLAEEKDRLFEKAYLNKHMTMAFRVKKVYWDKIPSAMHVDGTARAQFVEKKDNPSYYKIIEKFKEKTGYGIIVNTSFNLHGRTIVMTPEHAIRDFIDCGIDAMVIEGFLVVNKKNKEMYNWLTMEKWKRKI